MTNMEKSKSDSSSCIPRKRRDKHGRTSSRNSTDFSEEPPPLAPELPKESTTPVPPPSQVPTPRPITQVNNTSRRNDLVITNRNSFMADEEAAKNARSYVGFSSLPKQVLRKCLKKGFGFTLMVAGEGGLGKSTLINSLFLTDIYMKESYVPGAVQQVPKTEAIKASTFELREGTVKLQLTIVDTPGFGDDVDNTESCDSITKYVEGQFESYLNSESRVRREDEKDTRVHCCLYFIPPTGHGLRPADIVFMKNLHDMVNVVPVIAKADSLTAEECAKFKVQIMKEIEANDIRIYTFPPFENGLPVEHPYPNPNPRRVPFAVIGSNTVVDVDGKLVRGRKYPWGTVLVENTEHCDFIALRDMLVRTHMHDLIDVTQRVHYENFRANRLSGLSGGVGGCVSSMRCGSLNINPLEQMERERQAQENKLRKMEKEMELVFEMKVKEKERKMKHMEDEFIRKFDLTMSTLGKSRNEVEERMRRLAVEREQFYRTYGSPGPHEKEITEKERRERKKMRLFQS